MWGHWLGRRTEFKKTEGRTCGHRSVVGHPQLNKMLAVDADAGPCGCCTLAITVAGCVVAICVGCTTGTETG